ncbi:MAG: hypothetical protein A2017_04560 [Lentisphaerae bacterium GWF2_44_16]|nr:MAG: hypothetical protein A2017_04560 [Lentisphaerae bacterium GWF2_44_16]
MTDNEIRDKVKNILIEWFEIEPEQIIPDAELRKDFEFDSLDTVDFVVALEKEFKFKIKRPDDETAIRAMRTLSDVFVFIKEKLKQADN